MDRISGRLVDPAVKVAEANEANGKTLDWNIIIIFILFF
jgi:hypothetical protein